MKYIVHQVTKASLENAPDIEYEEKPYKILVANIKKFNYMSGPTEEATKDPIYINGAKFIVSQYGTYEAQDVDITSMCLPYNDYNDFILDYLA